MSPFLSQEVGDPPPVARDSGLGQVAAQGDIAHAVEQVHREPPSLSFP